MCLSLLVGVIVFLWVCPLPQDIRRSVNIATGGYLSSMQGLVAAFEKLFILKQLNKRYVCAHVWDSDVQ